MKTAQVNSQNELDAYLADRWSLTKEKTYVTIGRVSTQNYTDGVHSPVNGLKMQSNANNKITSVEFDIWMNLLKKIKNSVLWLYKSYNYSNIFNNISRFQ